MNASDINFAELGKALRASSKDAHEDIDFPPVAIAYEFLLENPDCFIDGDEWPADMPQEPPATLVAAYYGAFEDGLQ